jgi:hypothetical protein
METTTAVHTKYTHNPYDEDEVRDPFQWSAETIEWVAGWVSDLMKELSF